MSLSSIFIFTKLSNLIITARQTLHKANLILRMLAGLTSRHRFVCFVSIEGLQQFVGLKTANKELDIFIAVH